MRMAAILALMSAACAPGPTVAPPSAVTLEHPVGMITRDYSDDQRQHWDRTGPRPLRTAIWYPAPRSAAMTETVTAGLVRGGGVGPAAAGTDRGVTYAVVG